MDISTIFPVGNRGSILVTTRNPRCTVHASAGSHELGEMGIEDGVKLFLRAANLEDASSELIQEEARAIVKTLGFLALAMSRLVHTCNKVSAVLMNTVMYTV